ncbi:MAG: Fic family protein [Candidatus Pacebacteria bacterium]|nr:Fic family protein [Candidatus Paceibacterota bacterium]
MAGHSRYNITNKSAGLEGGVLKNKLGISSQKELEDAETILLVDAYEFFLSKENRDIATFDVKFLFSIHKYFLSTLYDWAGRKREVDISKGKMMFASVNHLDSSLKYLDKILKEDIPKKQDKKNDIAYKIAFIHNEYNAVHPFREGNGRTIRLFLDLLVSSIGYEMIDWSPKSKNDYIKACIFGSIGNHKPMINFILKRLRKIK